MNNQRDLFREEETPIQYQMNSANDAPTNSLVTAASTSNENSTNKNVVVDNSQTFPSSSSSDNNNADSETDICRVCRCEGTADKPLFYPCVCTGSIKYIHQDWLV